MKGTVIHPGTVLAFSLVGWLGVTMAVCPQALGASKDAARRAHNAEADALFTNGTLHVLKIDVSRQGMQSLRHHPRVYVKATLREGRTVFTNVLVRLKGGAGSFQPVDGKPGFTVKLEEGDEVFHGLGKFHLNNSVQDDTYLSEWFCSQLFREAGVPAGRVAHAAVELNGRPLGLYVLLESTDSDFLARHFKQPHGNVYSLSANTDVSGGLEQIGGREKTNGAELLALAKVARDSDPERLKTRLPQVLDLPRFLSFMAVEVMLDHWDGYTFNIKNYSVYHNPEADQIVFLPHDLDQVLRNPTASILPSAQGMVARAVLRQPEFRSEYRQRFEEVFTNSFVASTWTRRIDERVAQLVPEIKKYQPALAAEFANNAADLKSRIVRRAKVLNAKLKPRPAVNPEPAAQAK